VVTLGRGVDLIAVVSEAVSSRHRARRSRRWLEPLDPQFGSRIDIPPGELTLGRSAPSNVLLDSPLVSHLHARLERTSDHLVVSDLASSNGTFVNGTLIREPVELADGDTLSIAGAGNFASASTARAGAKAPRLSTSARTPVDSEWKTRLVWSADELVELEADRQRILAAWKKEQAAAAGERRNGAGRGEAGSGRGEAAATRGKTAAPARTCSANPRRRPRHRNRQLRRQPVPPPAKPAPQAAARTIRSHRKSRSRPTCRTAETRGDEAAPPAKPAEPPRAAGTAEAPEPAKATKSHILTGAPIRQVTLTGSSGTSSLDSAGTTSAVRIASR
jgi:pSer/pThr/pTyr-binding forkhead associated (FHA) protein